MDMLWVFVGKQKTQGYIHQMTKRCLFVPQGIVVTTANDGAEQTTGYGADV